MWSVSASEDTMALTPYMKLRHPDQDEAVVVAEAVMAVDPWDVPLATVIISATNSGYS